MGYLIIVLALLHRATSTYRIGPNPNLWFSAVGLVWSDVVIRQTMGALHWEFSGGSLTIRSQVSRWLLAYISVEQLSMVSNSNGLWLIRMLPVQLSIQMYSSPLHNSPQLSPVPRLLHFSIECYWGWFCRGLMRDTIRSAISNDENECRHMCLFIRIFINNFFLTF